AQATTQIQMLNADTLCGQVVDQCQHALQCIEEGADFGQLAADVAVHAFNHQPRQAGGFGVHARGIVNIDAEFVFFQAGGNVRVSLGVNVRVHAQGNVRGFAQLYGNAAQAFQFGFGFDVKTVHAHVQRAGHFRGLLTNAGKDDFVRLTAGGQHPLQFTQTDDIE